MITMSVAGPVLVAVDLSDGADEALRQADTLARSIAAPLHVCHVLPELARVRMLFPHFQQRDSFDLQALQRGAAETIAARVRTVTGRSPGEYSVSIDAGSPHSGILQQADEIRPGILVLGAGDVAARVVRHAPCPVLVARLSPPGKVLGTTDFSDPSLPAVEAAVSEAKRRDVALCLIHSFDWITTESAALPMGMPLPAVPPDLLEDLRASTRGRLEDCLRSFGAEGECFVGDGYAADAIARLAEELPAELVVVGTRGRTGLARFALGSVAEGVVSRAPCSVLVVRLREG
jgi:nucleotide-binding universal stress UspA family protein